MKRMISFVLLFLIACATPNMITGSWKSEAYNEKQYSNILVAALTSQVVGRSAVESDIAKRLSEQGVTAQKSINLFPPKMSASDSDRVMMMKAVKGKDIEAILTVSMLKKETESRYVPGYVYDPYRYSYYRNFWGYYSYWYPYSYSPGYYTESTVYYMETNLYDVKTEELVWSAQSRTYEGLDFPTFSKDFAKTVVGKLKTDRLLKVNNQEKKSDDYFGNN
jgi:hypothetical protein